MRLRAFIGGIGVLGPGLGNWPDTVSVLSERVAYVPAPTVLHTPSILPPAERRRTGRSIKLALGVALEATAQAATDPALLASVFSSSGGDGHICHDLCQALALETREVSPTKFANSVHNAAAGYWSIATGAKRESNVLCAFDASFCAGLLEAMTQVCADGESLLLVTYDTEYPEPIHAKRPIPDAFGVALVLTPNKQPNSLACIDAALRDEPPDMMRDPLLESLRRSIPAARCLPMLEKLACGQAGHTVLEYLDVARVVVNVEPCT